MIEKRRPAGIQYAGRAGVSEPCAQAVQRFLQCNDRISNARLLSNGHDHCFLLTIDEYDQVAVKCGFTSGYCGEGPRALARALQLLVGHGIEVEEILVGKDVLERVDHSALTERDLQAILDASPVRPTRVYDYIYNALGSVSSNPGTHWDRFRPIIPLALVDQRLADLALRFREAPGDALLQGFRRLEDTIRTRLRSEEHGAKLFAQAFQGDASPLLWEDVQPSEIAGRVNLFTGAYMAHRNPRAHKELTEEPLPLLSEFLLLNHLFRMEARAVSRPVRAEEGGA